MNLSQLVAGTLLLSVLSLSAVDLSGYTPIPSTGQRQSLVKDGYFENPAEQPKPVTSMVQLGRFGRNAGGGIRIMANVKTPRVLHYIPIADGLFPKKVYKLGIWLKASDGAHPIVCMEVYNKQPKTWKYGQYNIGMARQEGDWRYYEGTFTTRGENPQDYFYYVTLGNLRRGKQESCEVCFDDLELYENLPEWYFAQTWPTHQRTNPTNAELRFSNQKIGPLLKQNATTQIILEVKNGEKTIAEKTLDGRPAILKTSFGKLPAGDYRLKATLLDTRNKLIVATQDAPLKVVDFKPNPQASCVIDRRGRAFINGKKTLLIGLYTSFDKDDMSIIERDYRKISSLGFNCVHDYQFGWKPRPKTWQMNYLNLCQKLGIYASYSVYRQAGCGEDSDARERQIRDVIDTYKNHPAILGWYLQDEPPPAATPRLCKYRQIINQHDPNHPTWLVAVFWETPFRFYPATDLYSWDPYPFGKPDSNLRNSINGAEILNQQDPLWWAVPQAFSWVNYNHKTKDGQHYLDPSADQMLSNALIQAMNGAKAFIFYSWFDQFRGPKERLAPRMKNLAEIARVLKSLEPYIMSDKDIEHIAVKDLTGLSKAVIFRADDGRIACVIVGAEYPKNTSTFTLPASLPQLHSVKKMTVGDGKGTYRFASEGVNYDILLSHP